MGLKQKLLNISTIKKIPVPKELSNIGDIYIKRLSGGEMDIYETAKYKAKEEEKTKGNIAYLVLQPLIISLALCDEDGSRVFDKPEEVQKINDNIIIEFICMEAMKLNCLTKETRAELEKKFLDQIGSGIISPGN